MTKDLYFIHLIADAFHQPDPKLALKAALQKILELGQLLEYARGFEQFKRFIEVMGYNYQTPSQLNKVLINQILEDLSFQIAAGLFTGDQKKTKDLLNLITSQPELKKDFKNLCEEASKAITQQIGLKIIIDRNEETIISIPVKAAPFSQIIKNIKPGQYEVRLNTGRMLWQGKLTDRDLLWTAAFPEKDMALAADTGDVTEHPTREISLLDGELIIRVIPELESGRIELKRKDLSRG
jgi:hypothetical protein